jgi:tripartite-type tricarboxylate transporter receptor subunit TctC
MGLADLPILLPHLQSGSIRALAIGHSERVPWLPDVPTMREAGLPEVNTDNWHGFMAPSRVPPAILAQLQRAAVAALRDPDTARALFNQGALPGGNSAEDFGRFIREETARWGAVIRRAGITVD